MTINSLPSSKKVKNFLSWIEIDSSALLENVASFKKLIGSKVKFLAVVKSNAYGHGIVEVVQAIREKVDWFGVNSLDEAFTLKKNGIRKPILILGYTQNSRLAEVVKNNFRQVVYNRQTGKQLLQNINILKSGKKIKIHLKIETGTNRQGVENRELLEIAKILTRNPKIEVEGAYTHFANAEESEDSSFPKEQIERFKRQLDFLEKSAVKVAIKHTACTAATILLPKSYFDMVRLGVGLYGLWPSKLVKKLANRKRAIFNLKPVLTWKTRVAQVKNVKKSETIGYGRTYKVRKEMKIAILPIGYYEGYDRHLSNCGQVLVSGRFAPVVGRVMMNMTIVDITHIPNVKVEDEIVLIGKQGKNEVTVEDLAEKICTINYEVVARINPFIPRILV